MSVVEWLGSRLKADRTQLPDRCCLLAAVLSNLFYVLSSVVYSLDDLHKFNKATSEQIDYSGTSNITGDSYRCGKV